MSNTQEAAREIGFDPTRPTVLITGASRGIGLGFAARYADDDWNVIATARNPAGARELQNLAARSSSIVVEELDVLNETELDLLANKYANVPIDVLINNAAFHGGKPADHRLGSYSYSTFERYMAVNVFGPLKVCEAFHESVAKSKQRKIVTLTTRLSCLSTPPPFNAFHFQAISKTALNRAIRTLQLELGNTGIIVALISPGRTDTDGLAASRAAVAASLGESAAPPNQPAPLSVDACVASMVKVIADLDESYDGSHLDFQGNRDTLVEMSKYPGSISYRVATDQCGSSPAARNSLEQPFGSAIRTNVRFRFAESTDRRNTLGKSFGRCFVA